MIDIIKKKQYLLFFEKEAIIILINNEKIYEKSEEIIKLIEQDNIEEAVKIAKKLSPFRLTGILGDFPLDKIISFLELMDPERAADVLNEFPEEFSGNLIMLINEEKLIHMVKEMTGDELTDFLVHITEEKKDLILGSLTEQEKRDVQELAMFSEDLVGAHMEQDYLSVEEDTSVEETIKKVKDSPPEIEHTDYVFITEKTGKLSGLISLKDLLFATKTKKVKDIMKTNIHTARVDDNALEIAHKLRTRRFKMLPVIDEKNILTGVITLEEAVNLLSEEIAEDIVVFSGSSGEESFFTRPKESIKLRLPWMAANIFLNLGAVTVISSFENTIASIAILAAFLPMITDMGGNVGIQALSVSIRSLALEEAQLRDVFRSLKKELKIGLVNGLVLGIIFAILAFVFQKNIILAFVAGTALGVNVLVAGIIGGTMPFIIKRFGRDPALMTGPVLTTITDITGVTIYLGLSTLFIVYII